MRTPDDRIEQLIAAAVADDLTPPEAEELDRLAREHPWIGDEIARLHEVAARVSGVPWTEPAVTEALRERIVGAVPLSAAGPTRRRRLWVAPLAGAACLAVGVVLGIGASSWGSRPPTGPPGTLGAYEPLAVSEESGIDVEADLVAHTWGTEAVIDASGLTVGATYRVVFIDEEGTEFSAGEMLGSSVEIHCRLNAAVLRDDSVRFEIRDAAATVIASAELPRV